MSAETLLPAPAARAASADQPRVAEAGSTRAEESPALLAAIDASVRGPVLLFFASAASWLLLASALAVLDTLKLNVPWVLTDVAWLTFGRVHPAATSCFVYGWTATAGIGAALWIMARLCRTPVRHGGVLLAAWLLWNLGVTLGVGGILYGHGTSVNGLEFPRYASPLLFTAFVFTALWMVMAFRLRTQHEVYISQWYILAAFLFFPWMYATANLLLFFIPVQAPAQTVIAAWFAHGLVSLWFVPLALAAAYYVVPKVLGRPVAHYRFTRVGFWTWLLFSGWAGAYDLIGGPVPAWMLSLAVVASVLTVIPLYAIYSNFQGALAGEPLALKHSPSLRFVIVAVWCFLASGTATALTAFRSVNEVVHFTLLGGGVNQLMNYGFVSLALFGAVYYIVPRLVGVEWVSSGLIRNHFWFAAVALGLSVVGFALGGLVQGFGLDDAKVPVLAILSFVKPFLAVQCAAALLFWFAHASFAASFVLLMVRAGLPKTQGTLAVLTGAGRTSPNAAVANAGAKALPVS